MKKPCIQPPIKQWTAKHHRRVHLPATGPTPVGSKDGWMQKSMKPGLTVSLDLSLQCQVSWGRATRSPPWGLYPLPTAILLEAWSSRAPPELAITSSWCGHIPKSWPTSKAWQFIRGSAGFLHCWSLWSSLLWDSALLPCPAMAQNNVHLHHAMKEELSCWSLERRGSLSHGHFPDTLSKPS